MRVWDLPLRLFHWSLLLLFVIAYATGNREQYYGLHKAAGFALFGLLIFRLIWGFGRQPGSALLELHLTEGRPSRMSASFFKAGPIPCPDTTPLGGWAVAVMLILLLIEVVSGLSSAPSTTKAPWRRWCRMPGADRMAAIHSINLNLLLAMIGLHLLAIAVTSILGRENLVASMIHGRKTLAEASGVPARKDSRIVAAERPSQRRRPPVG